MLAAALTNEKFAAETERLDRLLKAAAEKSAKGETLPRNSLISFECNAADPPAPPPVDSGAGSADDNGMEKPIEKHEDFVSDANKLLVRIETCVDGICAHMATKADIASTKADIAALETTLLKWFIGTSIALSGIVFAAARFLK